MSVRLIAIDLDGTLLRPDHTISPRTLAALLAAQAAGVVVVPATGRSLAGLKQLLPRELSRLVVCSNGAAILDVYEGRAILERPIAPPVGAAFVRDFKKGVPGTRFAATRGVGQPFGLGPGYLDVADQGDHGQDFSVLAEVPLVELTAVPALKLIARHPDLTAEELLDLSETLDLRGVECTISGVPFMEVSAAGVTKESALAIIAAERGIDVADIVVFGDSLNDRGMLAWAGHGVAMGNSLPEVQAVADEVTARNSEDGIALVVERLLG